ncbi:MAG: hypothetical protein ACI7YS_07660 [Flavobacterium sp.]
MKNKYLLVAFVLGMLLAIVGAFLKIQHIEFYFITASLLIPISILLQVGSVLIFIIKLLTSKKGKEFLNK